MRERRHIDFRTHGENAADGGVWMTDLFIDHAILALRIPSVQVQHGQLSPETKAKERAAKTVHPSAAKRRTVQSIDLAQWGATCKQYLPPIQALVAQALDGLHLPPAQSVESEGSTSMPPLAVDLEALFSTFTYVDCRCRHRADSEARACGSPRQLEQGECARCGDAAAQVRAVPMREAVQRAEKGKGARS